MFSGSLCVFDLELKFKRPLTEDVGPKTNFNYSVRSRTLNGNTSDDRRIKESSLHTHWKYDIQF